MIKWSQVYNLWISLLIIKVPERVCFYSLQISFCNNAQIFEFGSQKTARGWPGDERLSKF